jgi:ABC-type sugar transport system ATPase subunit
MNFFESTLTRTGAGGMCTFRGADLTIPAPCEPGTSNRVFLGVRPHHLEVVGDDASGEGSLRAELGVVEPMGNEQIVYLTLPGGERAVAVAPVH